jgi:hypothetical protein
MAERDRPLDHDVAAARERRAFGTDQHVLEIKFWIILDAHGDRSVSAVVREGIARRTSASLCHPQ